jgi:hypothetical protein
MQRINQAFPRSIKEENFSLFTFLDLFLLSIVLFQKCLKPLNVLELVRR